MMGQFFPIKKVQFEFWGSDLGQIKNRIEFLKLMTQKPRFRYVFTAISKMSSEGVEFEFWSLNRSG